MNAPKVFAACSLLGLACIAPASHADTYPSRPVKMIVGFAPGGATDIAARLMAQALTQALGKSFYIDNRPGVGGLLALEATASAPADGYTIAVGTVGPLTISPELYKKDSGFDPDKRLDPVILFAGTPGLIVVRKDLKASNVRELIALSKAATPLTVASAGTGSIQHLMAEHFQNRNEIKWTHVPYKGSSPALVDVAAGRADVMVDVVPSAAPYVTSDRVRALAVTAPRRSAQLPDVPTLEELGYPGYDLNSWWSLSVPKGTPASVVETLNKALNDALRTPEMKDQLAKIGAEPFGGPPSRLAERVKVESTRWADIIRTAQVTSQ